MKKLDERQLAALLEMVKSPEHTFTEIGERFGTSTTQVKRIASNNGVRKAVPTPSDVGSQRRAVKLAKQRAKSI